MLSEISHTGNRNQCHCTCRQPKRATISGERIEEAICGTIVSFGRLADGAGERGCVEGEIEVFLAVDL